MCLSSAAFRSSALCASISSLLHQHISWYVRADSMMHSQYARAQHWLNHTLAGTAGEVRPLQPRTAREGRLPHSEQHQKATSNPALCDTVSSTAALARRRLSGPVLPIGSAVAALNLEQDRRKATHVWPLQLQGFSSQQPVGRNRLQDLLNVLDVILATPAKGSVSV
jgi:hypothetical protein